MNDNLLSPATTCSTSSFTDDCSVEHGEALFEDDDLLLQFYGGETKAFSSDSSETDEETVELCPSETLFWKEYELEVSKFCLSSIQSHNFSHSFLNRYPNESYWGVLSFGAGILDLVLKRQESEHRRKVVEKENKRLEDALAHESQRTAYYRNQVNFHREKSRDLEWNLLNHRAEEYQSRRPPT